MCTIGIGPPDNLPFDWIADPDMTSGLVGMIGIHRLSDLGVDMVGAVVFGMVGVDSSDFEGRLVGGWCMARGILAGPLVSRLLCRFRRLFFRTGPHSFFPSYPCGPLFCPLRFRSRYVRFVVVYWSLRFVGNPLSLQMCQKGSRFF